MSQNSYINIKVERHGICIDVSMPVSTPYSSTGEYGGSKISGDFKGSVVEATKELLLTAVEQLNKLQNDSE